MNYYCKSSNDQYRRTAILMLLRYFTIASLSGYLSTPPEGSGAGVKDPNQPGLSMELPSFWNSWIEEYATNAEIIKRKCKLKIESNFPDDVVILVKNKNIYTWYVNEKELWILDLLKLDNAFRRKMGLFLVNETHEEGERKGFEILDSHNIDLFQVRMKEYVVSYKELKEYYQIYSEVYMEDKYIEVFPSFFIDFDKKIFFHIFLNRAHMRTLYQMDGLVFIKIK